MKTTIDIADHIMARSKELARREHLTLRELVEEGLQTVIQQKLHASRSKINPITFKGRGLASGFRGASWEKFRRAAYEGHGS